MMIQRKLINKQQLFLIQQKTEQQGNEIFTLV